MRCLPTAFDDASDPSVPALSDARVRWQTVIPPTVGILILPQPCAALGATAWLFVSSASPTKRDLVH